MRGRYARLRKRLWARRAWEARCACLGGRVSRRFGGRKKGRDVPGAVWRSGWVDMTKGGNGPTEVATRACRWYFDEVQRTIDVCRLIRSVVQLQTKILVVGMSWREEVCITIPSKLVVAGRDGTPSMQARDFPWPIMTPT
jgi:hypothetical protein